MEPWLLCGTVTVSVVPDVARMGMGRKLGLPSALASCDLYRMFRPLEARERTRGRGGGHGSFLALLSWLPFGEAFPDPLARAVPDSITQPCSRLPKAAPPDNIL